MRKGGQPVDDGRETTRGLWTPAAASLGGTASPAVENRSAHVDDRAGDYLRSLPGSREPFRVSSVDWNLQLAEQLDWREHCGRGWTG